MYLYQIIFLELHAKWEARRAEKLEAIRAEKERLRREEEERLAAEEAQRKAEEEEKEKAKLEEGEEGGEKEVTEGVEAASTTEAPPAEEQKAEETEETTETTTSPDIKGSGLSRPSDEEIVLEEEELQLDKEIPPETPETEEFKRVRTNFDRDFIQLLSVVKGTNNIEPINVSVEKDLEAIATEVSRKVEGKQP